MNAHVNACGAWQEEQPDGGGEAACRENSQSSRLSRAALKCRRRVPMSRAVSVNNYWISNRRMLKVN